MQETAVRFAICDDDKVYAEKMKALILQTFHLPQPVEHEDVHHLPERIGGEAGQCNAKD